MSHDLSAVFNSTEEQQSAQMAALCRQFLGIARKKLSGTLFVSNVDDAYKSFLCHGGAIADLDTGRENTLLAESILDTGAVNARTLRKAEKTSEKHGLALGGVLLEMNAVAEDLVLETVQTRVAEEVTEIFAWNLDEIHFTPHSPEETLEGFRSDLSDYFDLRADPEELFLEACHRLDRWELIESNFEILRDVFYATPSTFRYFREPETYSEELGVLGSTDGVKDVEEVVRESALDPFEAMKIVRRLVREGEIELTNPVQMFQLGTDLAANGSLEKACKLFQRAKERGLNDFDLEFRLAETLDRLGRGKDASHWYLSFSKSCLGQLRIDEAINCLRRVVKIVPDHEVALDKLLETYLQQKRTDEALEIALKIVKLRENQRQHSAALHLLVDLKPQLDGAPRFHEKIVELAEICRRPEIAREEKQRLAQTFDARKDTQQALETYQSMFCAGDDSLEVRIKLVELHRQQGNRQKAIDHLNALLSAGGRKRVTTVQTLLSLHRTMIELRPGDSRSSRWLVDHYLEHVQRDNAINVLKSWRNELEREEDHEELVAVLEMLIELEGDIEHLWSLAKIFEKMDRTEDSQRELRRLAHLATGEEKFDQAARALDLILKKSPLDVETRKVQADLLETRGENRLAVERLKDVATLEIIAGHVQDAEEYCRRVLIVDPDAADIVDRLGVLCMGAGDQKKAVEQFLKAAKIHMESRNLGLARQTLDRLLEIESGNQEGVRLFEELGRLEASPPPAQPAPTPVVSSSMPQPGPEREPFQTTPPVLKTSISGITTRLRGLKSGDTGGGCTVKGLGNIAAKLKGLGDASASLPVSEPVPASVPTAPSPAPIPNDPPQDLMLEDPRTSRSVDDDSAPEIDRVTASGVLRAAAAGSKASTSPDATEDSNAPGNAADAPDGPEDAPGQAPPTALVRQKLGSAASRLAALRKGQ